MAAHRLKEARRRDGVHFRMAGPMLVSVLIEGKKLAVIAPKLLLDKPSRESAGAAALPDSAAPVDTPSS